MHVKKESNGRLHILQPHLINQIIQQLHMTKASPCSTPTKMELLYRNQDAPQTEADFNYKSIIGKLNYLERGIRSDITYTTH